jgi:uncharacterized repeat protein (TIGR01451 family)
MTSKRKLFSITLISAAIILMLINTAGATGGGAFTLSKGYTTNNPYDQTTYSAVGQTITYNYYAQDLNNEDGLLYPGRNDPSAIGQPMYITDNKTGTINVPGVSLITGSSDGTGLGQFSASSTYTITLDDINRGCVTNSAYATGQVIDSFDTNGNPIYSGSSASSSTDNVTVYYAPNPPLTLQKAATVNNTDDPTGQTYNAVGQTITYIYNVTNSGNEDILGPITITDNKIPGGPITISNVLLFPGDSVTGQATYTITKDDIEKGFVTNSATATGQKGSLPDTTIDFWMISEILCHQIRILS